MKKPAKSGHSLYLRVEHVGHRGVRRDLDRVLRQLFALVVDVALVRAESSVRREGLSAAREGTPKREEILNTWFCFNHVVLFQPRVLPTWFGSLLERPFARVSKQMVPERVLGLHHLAAEFALVLGRLVRGLMLLDGHVVRLGQKLSTNIARPAISDLYLWRANSSHS